MAIKFDPNSLKAKPTQKKRKLEDKTPLYYGLGLFGAAAIMGALLLIFKEPDVAADAPPPPLPQPVILNPVIKAVRELKPLPPPPIRHEEIIAQALRSVGRAELTVADFVSASALTFKPGRYIVIYKKPPESFYIRQFNDFGIEVSEIFSGVCYEYRIKQAEGLKIFDDYNVEGIYYSEAAKIPPAVEKN